MNNIIMVSSLQDYIKNVLELKPRRTDVSLYPEEIVFRGLSNSNYELTPSIRRQVSDKSVNTLLSFENDLISQANQKIPTIFCNDDLPITKLSKLQHFGLPTRMLDVTSSALVALYFACRSNATHSSSTDGEVIAFSYYALHTNNAYANIVADTYRLCDNMITEVENYYYRAVQQSYSIILQRPGWENNIQGFIPDFVHQLSEPLLIEALETCTRQKNQQAKYLIFPNKIGKSDKGTPDYIFNDLVKLSKDDNRIIGRYIIPNALKEKIVQGLSILGITEEFLFADSVDAVLKSVKQRQEKRFIYELSINN